MRRLLAWPVYALLLLLIGFDLDDTRLGDWCEDFLLRTDTFGPIDGGAA